MAEWSTDPQRATDRRSASEARPGVAVERLRLERFRSFAELTLPLDGRSVVLIGPNGAGKTNLLEAVSLLAPGQGLRRAPYAELTKVGSPPGAGWTVAAVVRTPDGPVNIGTGAASRSADGEATGRTVRIDRVPRAPSALAEIVEVLWLIPAMDGLLSGPASERRRFLDRLILSFDPAYRGRLAQYERAMRQRNALLEADRPSASMLQALELQIAETGVAIAAARRETVASLERTIAARRAAERARPFPWAMLALEGSLETELAEAPAVDVEDRYARRLAAGRERDRAAGRQLEGPHRSDLAVGHGPKAMPAALSSTGEQKALLVNLVLSHAELVAGRRGSGPPILLLDEITAHLDAPRRASLFEELLALGAQTWMTGTDAAPFAPIAGGAQILRLAEGRIEGAGGGG